MVVEWGNAANLAKTTQVKRRRTRRRIGAIGERERNGVRCHDVDVLMLTMSRSLEVEQAKA